MGNEQLGIAINSENFPDEVFREYIKTNFDIDKDGFLSENEICSVVEISLSEKDVKDLTGIGYFSYLKNLYCCNTKVKELDVSKNVSLEHLNCVNTEIKEKYIHRLIVSCKINV